MSILLDGFSLLQFSSLIQNKGMITCGHVNTRNGIKRKTLPFNLKIQPKFFSKTADEDLKSHSESDYLLKSFFTRHLRQAAPNYSCFSTFGLSQKTRAVNPAQLGKAYNFKMVSQSLIFSCTVSKTKLFTPAYHEALTKSIESIKIQFKYVRLVPSAEKRRRASHLWCQFHF